MTGIETIACLVPGYLKHLGRGEVCSSIVLVDTRCLLTTRSPDIIAACVFAVFVAGEKAAGGHFNYRKRAAKPDEEIHHQIYEAQLRRVRLGHT